MEGTLDSKYVLIKENLRLSRDSTLMDNAQGSCYNHLVKAWFVDASKLSISQKELNNKLLSILSTPPSDDEGNIEKLEKLLKSNENNPDLEIILNLKRGESGLTILHALASMAKKEKGMGEHEVAMCLLLEAGADPNIQNDKGETPLHYAIGWSGAVQELIERKANPNIRDIEGKIPLDYATAIGDLESVNALLEYRADVSNIKDESVLLEMVSYKVSNEKQRSFQSKTFWDHLMLKQQEEFRDLLNSIDEAHNMIQLEEVVSKAIECGVRLNFPIQSGKVYGNKRSFTDHVMKRIEEISELKKNSKIASGIVCKLVSRGAVFHDVNSMYVIDTLSEEFQDHKANMIKAHESYVKSTLKFMEIIKSAATGEVKDAKIDNSTLYLEYSKDSTIDIAKITDGARDLELTKGEERYGRSIIKIGNSEIEVETEEGIRNYTDLTEGSNIVLTFYTSLGEIDVRLYPDVQDKSKIIVEVSNKEEILKKFKNCEEELGEDCAFGDYYVYYAIEQGYFERSGGLMRPEVISQSDKKKVSWAEREESRRASDSREEIAR